MKPSPGGRHVATSAAPAPNPLRNEPTVQLPGRGLNRLVRAANPLLGLIVPLRTTVQPPDIAELRQRLMLAVRTFEIEARNDGCDPETVAGARYALCTVLDETIASTAWGSSVWGGHGLLVAFHGEASGGERFFLILQRLAQYPRENLDLLELMYLCLALGMEGRYRLVERGHDQLSALRERLQQLIASQHGSQEAELSPHWHGAAQHIASPLRRIPVWVLAVTVAVVLTALQIGLGNLLSEASDPVYASLQKVQLAPVTQRTPQPVKTIALPDAMAQFLAPEVAAGKVIVVTAVDRTIINVVGDGMFGPGSAEVQRGFFALLDRIGQALQNRPGHVQVIGHTDSSKPGMSARFPSNYELSKARATSVLLRLAQRAQPIERYTAEGRGDSEPLVSNDSASNRARNRRVQLVVLSPAVSP